MTHPRFLYATEDDALQTRFLRGVELAAHVTRGLATKASAQQIAQGAGYKVDRCAQLLSQALYAPLARILLARDWTEAQLTEDDERITAEWEAWKAERAARDADDFKPLTKRPPIEKAELLDELTDMSRVGLTFGDAADHLGLTVAQLRKRIRWHGLRAEAAELFPDRFRLSTLERAS